MDLWYWKRPLYQLSHNHCQKKLCELEFGAIEIARNRSDERERANARVKIDRFMSGKKRFNIINCLALTGPLVLNFHLVGIGTNFIWNF